MIDASKLGETVKEGKNQKTVLHEDEENRIINTFNKKQAVENFSVAVSYDEIKAKNYSLSAGQYFDVKIEHSDITKEEFEAKIGNFSENLEKMFKESKRLEDNIRSELGKLKI